MWPVTPNAFLSIVQKPSDIADDTLTVRSRDARSLEYFAEHAGIEGFKAKVKLETDYPFRLVATREQVVRYMLHEVDAIRYSNFKTESKRVRGSAYAAALGRVWTAMLSLTPASVQKKANKQWAKRYPAKGTGESLFEADSVSAQQRKELLTEHDAWHLMDRYLDGLERESGMPHHSMAVGDLTSREWDAFVEYHGETFG